MSTDGEYRDNRVRARARARARGLRVRSVHDIDMLIGTLESLRAGLKHCPNEMDQVQILLHSTGTEVAMWLDHLSCQSADMGQSADELFDTARQLLDSLPLSPNGFESRADPLFFAHLREATAGILARLWIHGFLLGPVPAEAWPNAELARLCLTALEHHCDIETLVEELQQEDFDGQNNGLE